eukprot:s3039_g1.t1
MMTKNLGQQCRSEMQGLMGDLFQECRKMEGASEKECLEELFWWFFGYTGAGDQLGSTSTSKLAAAPREAMLWAGFYDGDPRGLTQRALQNFANMVDTSIVHPSSILGKVVQKNNDLLGCRGDKGASRRCCCVPGTRVIDKGPVVGFWTGASRYFVHGMALKNQASVVAVLNKGLDRDKEWSLYKSVFWNYELPTLEWEIADPEHLDFRPQLLLVDMRGTCEDTARLDLIQWGAKVFSPPGGTFGADKDYCHIGISELQYLLLKCCLLLGVSVELGVEFRDTVHRPGEGWVTLTEPPLVLA